MGILDVRRHDYETLDTPAGLDNLFQYSSAIFPKNSPCSRRIQHNHFKGFVSELHKGKWCPREKLQMFRFRVKSIVSINCNCCDNGSVRMDCKYFQSFIRERNRLLSQIIWREAQQLRNPLYVHPRLEIRAHHVWVRCLFGCINRVQAKEFERVSVICRVHNSGFGEINKANGKARVLHLLQTAGRESSRSSRTEKKL